MGVRGENEENKEWEVGGRREGGRSGVRGEWQESERGDGKTEGDCEGERL